MSFSSVAAAFPWPSEPPFPSEDMQVHDGGGRELIIEILKQYPAPVLVEVGAFLGGSALRWLQSVPTVSVICVDPWEGDWWVPHARKNGWSELERRFAEPDGPLKCFQTNLWKYRDRVVAAKGYSPGKLHELQALGLKPDVIYFDSDKTGSGMAEISALFPDAVITGDDWSWGPSEGYPIRAPVRALASQLKRNISVRGATWVLQAAPLTPRQRLDNAISAAKDFLRPIRAKLSGKK